MAMNKTKYMSFNSLANYDRNIKDYISQSLSDIFEEIYPVGSIHISTNNVSPASLFGGTWERIEDVFLLGAGSTYIAGATGGEASHVLTVAEQPKIGGTITMHGKYSGTAAADAKGAFKATSTVSDKFMSGSSTGGANSVEIIEFDNGGKNQAHNNLPPYLVVNIWKRIA